MLSHLQVRGQEPAARRLPAAGDCLQMIEALTRTVSARDAATYEHAECARAGQAYDPELVDLFLPLIDGLRAAERQVLAPRFPPLVRGGWLTDARAAG